VHAAAGLILNATTGRRYAVTPLPPRLMSMIEDGGLTSHLKRRFAHEAS
jgi:3-isopropylmalate/(R)-2-methylmalate dehydratase small subunit